MGGVYLDTRRQYLLRTQNADGGWGYFPGKSSWLEPTAYAMLALHGDAGSPEALQRAWRLIEKWQLPDGSWCAGSQVQDGTWVTALAVTLCSVEGKAGPMLSNGVNRLLETEGAERSTLFQLMTFLGVARVEADTSHAAWPWRPGNASWVEPTAHTIVALKKAQVRLQARRVRDRVLEGEKMVLVRRCADGGWNHGSSRTYQVDAPSYPESTALALLALQGRRSEVGSALEMAREFLKTTKSPLANAWLTIALQIWGETLPPPDDSKPIGTDIMLTALEALAHPAGNHGLFRTEEAA
jgi:hypothetical protein